MNNEYDNEFDYDGGNGRDPTPKDRNHWHLGDGMGWFESLRNLWQWDELAAEIRQESQSRVAFTGLKGAGKSLLFNRLRGWVISDADQPTKSSATYQLDSDLAIETLGLFVLADLPSQSADQGFAGPELLLALGDPVLVVYLLDGAEGVRADDFRWVAALRASGRPLIVVLNKTDLITQAHALTTEAIEKLGMPVIPLSAETGVNVETQLLPAMLDAVPQLAVPLGRELRGLRRTAARRVIRQAAIFSGLMGAQPVPMLDIPLQAMVQVGVVMRVGAAYGYTPTGGMNREMGGTVISTLGLRYLVLALVKFIPFIGWAIGGVLCTVMTYILGEAAIRYYEAGATVPLREFLQSRQSGLRTWRREVGQQVRRKMQRPKGIQVIPASYDNDEEEIIPVTEELT